MQQDRACFTMKYEYTPELVRRFCRVHLWYRKRQHPLLLKAPGVFLTFCLIGRILYPGGGETGGLTLAMMGLFDFILLWMGFVHPWVFRRTMLKDLRQHPPGQVTLRFYNDRVEAANRIAQKAYSYAQLDTALLTQDCIYLYAGEQAVLIPANALEEREKHALQAFLQQKMQGKLRVRKAL